MAVKLFEHPVSPYARKVKIALYEKGIPFDRVIVDPGRTSDDATYQEFVLTSPRREIPALVDGEVRLADSTVILEYLDDRWPNPQLVPDRAGERGRVRMLEEMMDTEYEAVNWGISEICLFRRAEGKRAEMLLTRATLQLQRLWNRLERELEGRGWMNGASFGRGDLSVYPHLDGSRFLGYTVAEHHPRLRRWLDACASRPSVVKEAREVSEALTNLTSGLTETGPPRIRQYRDHRLEWMLKTGAIDIVQEGLEKETIRFSVEYE